MYAVEMFIERRELSHEEQEERNSEKLGYNPDSPPRDETLYLVDINLYLDPSVQIHRLGPLVDAISIKLRETPVVVEEPDIIEDTIYSVLVMEVEYYGTRGLSDNVVKGVAHSMASDMIRRLLEADPNERIQYPYKLEDEDVTIFLFSDASHREPDESQLFSSDSELPFDTAPWEDQWSREAPNPTR